MSPDPSVTIALLGPVAVLHADTNSGLPVADAVVAVAGVRAKRLLAALALADGHMRSAERLIGQVWGDDLPRSPNSALHTQISRLRQLLGPGHLEGSGAGYRLVDYRTDLAVVADLIDAGALEAAMSWWRGVPGDDLGDDASGGLARDLSARADQLGEVLDTRRYAAAMDTGDYPSARTIAAARCRRDELNESAHLDLMRALAAQGRVSDALAEYRRLHRRLASQLGIDPGAEIAALHDQLLTNGGVDTGSAEVPGSRRDRSLGLTADVTDLIGRERELDEIGTLLAAHRLVTVQGPGGAGKTRIANRLGQRLDAQGVTVLFVPLAAVRNDDDVLPAIAAALGVGEGDFTGQIPHLNAGDLHDRLLDALRGRNAVLILDNCEQVVERCARFVADVLAADQHLRVMVTSRSPLMVAAEQIYVLPMLDASTGGSATALFVARAHAVRPDADMPTAQVSELCRRLDGLPLAIELAAARIRTMTVAEILERLAERFTLLRGSDRSAPDRHRTMSAVIEWSWDLLDPDAKDALCRLCRFPGGFTTHAAAKVLGYSGIRCDDTLEALVNQSLLTTVESQGRMRYRMLETVREFGETRLSATPHESAAVQMSMQRWAADFADDAMARYEKAASAQLVTDISEDSESLVWVLRRCVEYCESASQAAASDDATLDQTISTITAVFPVLAGLWTMRGLHAEVVNWGPRILAVLPVPPGGLDVRRAQNWQATLLALSVHQVMRKNLRALATARCRLRQLYRPQRKPSGPIELVTACVLSRTTLIGVRHIVRGIDSDNPAVARVALAARMSMRYNAGDFQGAQSDGVTLRHIASDAEDAWSLAMIEASLGGFFAQQELWHEAIGHYRRAVTGLVAIGAAEDEVQSRCSLALALVGCGEMAGAAAELRTVAAGWRPDMADPQGGPEVSAGIMLAFAEYELASGRLDLAADLYGRSARRLCDHHPFLTRDADALTLLSVAVVGLHRVGHSEQARQYLPVLRDGVATAFGWFGRQGLPQAGAWALAIGYLLCAEPGTRLVGARLMAISRRLRARRDYPGIAAVDASMSELSGLSEDQWRNETRSIGAIPRRRAVAELEATLAAGELRLA